MGAGGTLDGRGPQRWRLAVLAFATATASLTACTHAPAPEKLTVAAATRPGSAPVYVAQAKGYFRDEGLDVTVRPYAAGRFALSDTLNGKADIATVSDTPIALAVLNGQTPAVIGTISEAAGANVIIARKGHGIAKAADLAGKRVGVIRGTSADYFLHVYLVASGVEPSSVSVVPLEPEELVGALRAGKVDAISAADPQATRAEEALGPSAVVLSDPTIYTQTWNVAVRPETVRDRPAALDKFLRAVARANDFIASNPSEAQMITANGTGVPVSTLKREWATNIWTLTLEQSLILTLEDEARWASGKRRAPDFLAYVETGPLRRVHPEGVNVVVPKD